MNAEWTKYEVSDLLATGKLLIGDGYRAKNVELGAKGLPFARAGNIDNGFHFENSDRFPKESLARVGNKVSQPSDVVFTSKGTVGRFAFVRDDTERFVYSPQLCFWRSLDWGFIHPRFLYYWMFGREFFSQYKGVAGQTDMAEYVSLTDQRRMYITLPRVEEQRVIAHVLGTLDDKIELNRRMNETLEAMAQALFKSWFINPTAKGLPAGLRETELDEIAHVIDCLHSKKPERRTDGKPLLQLWNISDDGLIDMSDTYYISDEDYHRWISRMEAMPGDCVITNVGRVAATAQIPQGMRAALGRNMTGIRCRSSFRYPTFLLECLRSAAMKDEIAQKTDIGTILDALNVRNIPHLRLSKPTDEQAAEFEQVCRPLRTKMELNLKQSRTLATLRNALLPKLLSGTVRINANSRATS